MLVCVKSDFVLRVIFYDYAGSSWLDKCMHHAVSRYSQLFGYKGKISHCGIQLNSHYYEISSEGCYREEWDSSILELPFTVGYYEIDLNDIEEAAKAAQFMLDYDFQINRKLDWWACVRYAVAFMRLGQLSDTDKGEATIDFSLEPGSIKKENNLIHFNLPFTCATQVINVLGVLFKIGPALDCHIPDAIAHYLISLAEAGYGCSCMEVDYDTRR
jgi:hypothetical protein